MAPAAGRARTAGLLGLLLGASLVQPVACGPGPGDDTPRQARRALEDLWPQVIGPALDQAAADALVLEEATAAWAEAEAAGDGAAARAAAREAWFAAMASWQRVELLQIGPAASSLTAVGGQDLRDEVYSWPTTNPCRVDQETVEEAWRNPDFFEVELVNTTGLDALEVLLFGDDGTNACPPQVGINADGTWAALGPDGIAGLRAGYAATLAARVGVELGAIQAAWDPAGGDFAGQLAAAGEPGSPFETVTEGLNAILDAALYLEIWTRERKLAGPLGLATCGPTDCLDEVETPLAGGSDEWIRSNLAGFRALWLGGEGTGLDDVLRANGEGALADRVLAALEAAEAAAEALTVPVDQAVATDPTPALAVHEALGGLTALLEGDVATVLLLTVPDEAAGDND